MLNDQQGSVETPVEAYLAPETRKRSLYDISDEYSSLEQLMDSIDGDISPEDAARIDEFLTGLDRDRDTKLENYGHLIKEWEARGKSRVEEGKRIKALGDTDLNKAKYLKNRLLNFFQLHKITDAIKTFRFNFRRQKNGGAAPVVFALSVQDNLTHNLPEEFILRVPTPNADLIRQVLESPDDPRKGLLDGIAWIGERGEHLRIS